MTEDIDNILSTPRGAEGLGIGEKYPVAEYGPPGWSSATWSELREAGFDRPSGAEPVILDAAGEPHTAYFFVLVLHDEIVAVWDEGRWWTPAESEAFATVLGSPLMRQLAEATAMNREQRRRKQ